jgi:hypothetical protein
MVGKEAGSARLRRGSWCPSGVPDRRAYGKVMVVPSPVAVTVNVPAVLDV